MISHKIPGLRSINSLVNTKPRKNIRKMEYCLEVAATSTTLARKRPVFLEDVTNIDY
jgi:hypothetical protein